MQKVTDKPHAYVADASLYLGDCAICGQRQHALIHMVETTPKDISLAEEVLRRPPVELTDDVIRGMAEREVEIGCEIDRMTNHVWSPEPQTVRLFARCIGDTTWTPIWAAQLLGLSRYRQYEFKAEEVPPNKSGSGDA
jgi:hypothetical protein